MSRRRSPSCFGIFIFLAAAGACLLLVFSGGLAWLLPQRAAQLYGPPRPDLNEWLRLSYAFQVVRLQAELTTPLNPGAEAQPFRVSLGEPAGSIAQRLADQGIIRSPQAFVSYLVYTGLDVSLQAGEYSLSPAMSTMEIAQTMQDATPMTVRFGILAGWRVEEIAAAIETSGLAFSSQEFLEAARRSPVDYTPDLPMPTGASMEGFFFPGVYEVRRDATLEAFMQTVLASFNTSVNSDMRSAYERQGLDLFQAVTLASIVEREAVSEDEMPLIASVFLNRLAVGMKLDSDPTVQYALGYNQGTWWTNPLTAEHLSAASPYNTYQAAGLPPGPIASPSLLALRAVAFPAQSPYYYFRAACDGSGRHNFAETFEQHLQNGCP